MIDLLVQSVKFCVSNVKRLLIYIVPFFLLAAANGLLMLSDKAKNPILIAVMALVSIAVAITNLLCNLYIKREFFAESGYAPNPQNSLGRSAKFAMLAYLKYFGIIFGIAIVILIPISAFTSLGKTAVLISTLIAFLIVLAALYIAVRLLYIFDASIFSKFGKTSDLCKESSSLVKKDKKAAFIVLLFMAANGVISYFASKLDILAVSLIFALVQTFLTMCIQIVISKLYIKLRGNF